MKTEKKDNKKVKVETTEQNIPGRLSGVKAFLKSEPVHFIFGLAIVLVAAFALLAFVSFFFNGGADQSVIDTPASAETQAGEKEVQNIGALQGARLADYFINGTFGAPTVFLVLFMLVAGLKMIC